MVHAWVSKRQLMQLKAAPIEFPLRLPHSWIRSPSIDNRCKCVLGIRLTLPLALALWLWLRRWRMCTRTRARARSRTRAGAGARQSSLSASARRNADNHRLHHYAPQELQVAKRTHMHTHTPLICFLFAFAFLVHSCCVRCSMSVFNVHCELWTGDTSHTHHTHNTRRADTAISNISGGLHTLASLWKSSTLINTAGSERWYRFSTSCALRSY